MQRFTELYQQLDSTNRTAEKVAILEDYFATAPPADAAWAVYFLLGNRVPRAVNTTRLREWLAAAAGWPLWLIEESYDAVGDLAETLALLAPPGSAGPEWATHTWWKFSAWVMLHPPVVFATGSAEVT